MQVKTGSELLFLQKWEISFFLIFYSHQAADYILIFHFHLTVSLSHTECVVWDAVY